MGSSPARVAFVVLSAVSAWSSAEAQGTSVTWTSAVFSSDGAFLLTHDRVIGVGRTRGTHLWDARSGELVDVRAGRAAFLDDPVRSRDARPWLVEWSERDKRLAFKRPDRREVALTLESATRIVEAGLTGARERLAYVLDQRAIRAFHFETGQRRWEFDLEGIALYEFAGHYIRAAPDGRSLVLREKTGALWIIDTASGKGFALEVGPELDKLSRHNWNHGMLFSRDGTRLYLGHSAGMDVVSTRSWTVLHRIRPAAPCAARRNGFMQPAAETPEGDVVALMDVAVACTIDGRNGTLKSGFDPITAFTRMGDRHSGFLDENRQSLSADGRRYVLYNYVVDRMTLWQPSTGVLVREMRTQGYGRGASHPDRRSVALTPDGQRLLVFDNFGQAPASALWDVATGRRLYVLEGATR